MNQTDFQRPDEYHVTSHDGRLCLAEVRFNHPEPTMTVSYWPTQERVIWQEGIVGSEFEYLGNGRYRQKGGTYVLSLDVVDGRTPLLHFAVVAVRQPKQRGKQYPVEWVRGWWYKQTRRGLVRLDPVSFADHFSNEVTANAD